MPDSPNAPQDRSATIRDLAAFEQRMTSAIAAAIEASDRRTAEAIEALARQTSEAIAASEARAAEHARDLQTELLTGMEAFARGNFTRFHTLESE